MEKFGSLEKNAYLCGTKSISQTNSIRCNMEELIRAMETATEQFCNAVVQRLMESGKVYKVKVSERYTDEDYDDLTAIRWNEKFQRVECGYEHECLFCTTQTTPTIRWYDIQDEFREPIAEIYKRIIWE